MRRKYAMTIPFLLPILSLLFVPFLVESASGLSSSGMLRVAVSSNNYSSSLDWANGTLYHLKVLSHFIPMKIEVIDDFSNLSNYSYLFLNRGKISDTEVTQVSDWVSTGGVLVCIGQSGRYNLSGVQRTVHPFADVLGLELNSWQRTSGTPINSINYVTKWQWWNPGDSYTLFYQLPSEGVSRSQTLNVTATSATTLATFKDTDNNYPTPAITRNSYGVGKAYLISADIFWLIGYNPTYPNSENIWADQSSNFDNPTQSGFPTLMMDLMAIIYDTYKPKIVLSTMPNGYYGAMGWVLHTEGTDTTEPTPDERSIACYSNLLEWRDNVFVKYPSLKGDFWNIMLITEIADGTVDGTDIIDFIKEWGTGNSHTHSHPAGADNPADYLTSFQKLNQWFPDHQFSLDCEGGGGMDVSIQEYYDIWANNNGTGCRGFTDQWLRDSYFSFPYPIANKTHMDIVKTWAKGWGGVQPYSNDIQAQRTFGQLYGLGGYALTNQHDYERDFWVIDNTLPIYLNDQKVWKVGLETFMKWWNTRWQTTITEYSENSDGDISIQFSTPNINGLTLFLQDNDSKKVYVDGYYAGETNDRIALNFTAGSHTVKFTDKLLTYIDACDSLGNKKDAFTTDDQIYVKGSGYSPSRTYNISLVNNVTWTDGMNIPSHVASILSNSDPSGVIPATPMWSSPTPGHYDIIVDVNDNHKYDQGTDILDNNTLVNLPRYYIDVTSLHDSPTTSQWVDKGANLTVSVTSPADDDGSGTRYRCTGYTLDDKSPITNGSTSYDFVDVGSNHTVTFNWIVQYELAVSSDHDTPYPAGTDNWYDTGTLVTASVNTPTDTVGGTRYRCTGWTGTGSTPASGTDAFVTFAITQPSNATWNWKTQYLATFVQIGLGTDFSDTVINVDSVNYNSSGVSLWWDDQSIHSFAFQSPLVATPSVKKYVWDSTIGLSNSQSDNTFQVNGSGSVIGDYKTQWYITFDETGISSDFTGTMVVVDAANFDRNGASFWWFDNSNHSFAYQSPLIVSLDSKRYTWNGTSGLSTLQSDTITATGSGTVTGNYNTQWHIALDQTGVGSDFTDTVVTIDGIGYNINSLPLSTWCYDGTIHSFAYQTPLVVAGNQKLYSWNSTSGLSATQTGTIIASSNGTIVGNYLTQYYTAVTSAHDSPTTSRWIYAGSDFNASVTSPIEVVPNDHQWTCTGFSVDGGLIQAGTQCTLNDVQAPHSINFVWNEQFWIQVNSAHDQPTVSQWADQGSNPTASVTSPADDDGIGTRYRCVGYTLDNNPLITDGSVSYQFIDLQSTHTITFIWIVQYRLTLGTSPLGVATPIGAEWYDAGTKATISTPQYVDIVSGSSRYGFVSWTTSDMLEITEPNVHVTAVLMDQTKTVTANYVGQYNVTFTQTGVSPDFSETVVTIDDTDYATNAFPIQLWWDTNSNHSYSFASPLIVDAGKQYAWSSTTGLSTLQSDTLTITTPGNVAANYAIQNAITFYQLGIDTDFTGIMVVIDGNSYVGSQLPISFQWNLNSVHTFAFQSPLIVSAENKQYVWTITTGLSALQSDSTTVSGPGNVTGNYKTQYYLTITSPYGTTDGQDWYDNDTTAYASLSTGTIDHGNGTRHVFTNWSGSTTGIDYAHSDVMLMNGPKTALADWKTQHNVAFTQSGLDSTATGTVATVDGVPKAFGDLPYNIWVDAETSMTYSYENVSSSTAGKRFILIDVSGPTSPIAVTSPLVITGNYQTQYYFMVSSSRDSPTPTSGWFEAGTSITASVTSPSLGLPGTRYVCTGWAGSGDVPAPGTDSSVTFTITQPSSIEWNWKTQYLLFVSTDPSELSPQPTIDPQGETEPTGGSWYDASTHVALTAQPVNGCTFDHWNIGGASQGNGVNPIFVDMNESSNAISFYSYDGSLRLITGWNMISFPVLPSNTSFASIFANVSFYQVVAWDGTKYVTPTNAEAGRGYWALVLTDTTLNITSNTSVRSYELDLPAGWSMIGSIHNCTANATRVFPGYYQLVTWDGTKYVDAITIEPGKGYWALVLEPTHIMVDESRRISE